MLQAQAPTFDCLRDYLANLPPNINPVAYAARNPIADSCQVAKSTIRDWTTGRCLPKGMTLIRLRYFLSDQGYQVSELLALSPDVLKLGRLVYEGKLSLEEIVVKLGYKNTHSLLRVFHGQVKPLPLAQATIKAMIDPTAPPTSAAPSSDSPDPIDNRLLITSTASFISGLVPLTAALVSAQCSDEDRQALREAAGNGNLPRLAQNLFMLCSRTARQEISRALGLKLSPKEK